MKFPIFLFLILLVKSVSCGIITNLPGYDDPLPFKLETGYVGLKDDTQQLCYYFVESRNDPSSDPILFWISGGPGYSSLYGFFFEFGPLSFNLSYKFDGSLPNLIDNKNDWSKFMNLLFVDAPVGTGFSYATTPDAYNTSHYDFAQTLNNFIHEWIKVHSEFTNNDIYISGDGFSGNPLPIALYYILQDNEAGREPNVNMRGYVLVSPGTDYDIDFNARITFANRMGFIPDKLYEEADLVCDGNFTNPPNDACNITMDAINELIENINIVHILEPTCRNRSPYPEILPSSNSLHRSLQENDEEDDDDLPHCRKFDHEICNVWANFEEVQNALEVRKGKWEIYNESVDHVTYYKDDLKSVVDYHTKLSQTDLRGIIISGDHDMDIPGIGTQKWIWNLSLSLAERWRPWTVDNETAGYTRKFENGEFSLTYATVKGGGHFTQEYRPKECYYMVKNWTSGLPL